MIISVLLIVNESLIINCLIKKEILNPKNSQYSTYIPYAHIYMANI